jgi:hypothetical protein
MTMVMQDSPTEDGQPSAEFTRFMQLLADTFTISAPLARSRTTAKRGVDKRSRTTTRPRRSDKSGPE